MTKFYTQIDREYKGTAEEMRKNVSAVFFTFVQSIARLSDKEKLICYKRKRLCSYIKVRHLA